MIDQLETLEMPHVFPSLCVWMEHFNEVIHFFEEFRFLCDEILCLDREIEKNLKCKHFFEVFQLVKLVEIQIPSK